MAATSTIASASTFITHTTIIATTAGLSQTPECVSAFTRLPLRDNAAPGGDSGTRDRAAMPIWRGSTMTRPQMVPPWPGLANDSRP
jgi:hypothetical protein